MNIKSLENEQEELHNAEEKLHNESEKLTADIARITELCARLGDPNAERERGDLFTRYEEIHAKWEEISAKSEEFRAKLAEEKAKLAKRRARYGFGDEYRKKSIDEDASRRTTDITRESNFALWNSLLTLNGIIISVFSAVAVFNKTNNHLVLIIIFMSMISASLMIFNFRYVRDHYKLLGKSNGGLLIKEDGDVCLAPYEEPDESKLDEEMEAMSISVIKAHRTTYRLERITNLILFAQGILILFAIYHKG